MLITCSSCARHISSLLLATYSSHCFNALIVRCIMCSPCAYRALITGSPHDIGVTSLLLATYSSHCSNVLIVFSTHAHPMLIPCSSRDLFVTSFLLCIDHFASIIRIDNSASIIRIDHSHRSFASIICIGRSASIIPYQSFKSIIRIDHSH